MTLAESTAAYLRACLEQHGGNMTHAARAAGVHRAVLYRLCAKYQIPSGAGRTLRPRSILPFDTFARARVHPGVTL